MKKINFIIILLLALLNTLKAQEWTKDYVINYSGKIDNKHSIELVLFIDSTACRGYYYYTSQNKAIQIEGSLENNKIKLVSSLYTECFEGKISSDYRSIEGTWTNNEGEKNFHLYPPNKEKAIAFRYFTYSESYFPSYLEYLKEYKDFDVSLNIDYYLPFPIDEEINSASHIIISSFRDDEFIFDKEKYISEIVQYSKDNYDSLVILLEDTNSYMWENFYDYMYTWTEEYHKKITYVDHAYIGIESFFYEYAGGAHGIYGSGGSVFQLNENRYLQLNDLFYEADSLKLREVFTKKLENTVGMKEGENLVEDYYYWIEELDPTENFIIKEDGMHFIYTVYEIASYASGETDLFFPYDELKPYLKKDFIKNCFFISD